MHHGDDLFVANAARVSNAKWRTEFLWHGDERIPPGESGDNKLIHYLARNKHNSPFFHPQITLRIEVPFFVRNQLLRHVVAFAVNECSRRYVDAPPEYFTPDAWRLRPEKSIKQGSSDETIPIDSVFVGWQNMESGEWETDYRAFLDMVDHYYRRLINSGVAPEHARLVLPQSAYTSWIWTGSLYAYFNCVRQRLDAHAQREIQEVARQISEIMERLYPVSWAALMEYQA
jgi:thymidylate synthase (FAD)